MTRDQVIQVIRNSGMTFHLGMPFEVVVEQMTRVIALVEIEATVKATRMAADAINEVQASQWPKEADTLTLAIQHLNSNPYALTKDECVDLIKKLREVQCAAAVLASQEMRRVKDWFDSQPDAVKAPYGKRA